MLFRAWFRGRIGRGNRLTDTELRDYVRQCDALNVRIGYGEGGATRGACMCVWAPHVLVGPAFFGDVLLEFEYRGFEYADL